MIRKFNYTGRKRIPRSRVSIRVEGEDAPRSFDADLRLDGLGLPPGAAVFVEAYHRSAYMRFPFGTVERPKPPADRRLKGIPVANPLFRVKVVERSGRIGKILAAADKVLPQSAEKEREGRHALLVVEYSDLGNRVWSLDLDGDWPCLHLNKAIDGVREAAHLLYLNRRRKGPRRGALQQRDSPGALRRFVDVVQQLDLNYDLYSMCPDAIVDLLPGEFDRWRPLRKRLRRRRISRNYL